MSNEEKDSQHMSGFHIRTAPMNKWVAIAIATEGKLRKSIAIFFFFEGRRGESFEAEKPICTYVLYKARGIQHTASHVIYIISNVAIPLSSIQFNAFPTPFVRAAYRPRY